MINEKELEQWIKDHPLLANAVLPSCIVLGAVTIQAGLILLIDWVV